MRRARPSRPRANARSKFAICNLHFAICNASPRSGATLTEVLITLLIMAIGVVTCATLFPISVMRSLHATQLTNATIVRHSAEAFVESWVEIDRTGPTPIIEFSPIFNPDRSDTAYHAEITNATLPPPAGYGPNYVIDPLGAVFARLNGNPTPGRLGSIPRYGLGTLLQAPADQESFATSLVTLRGSWTVLGEDIPAAIDFGTFDPATSTFTPNPQQTITFPTTPLKVDLSTAQQAAAATNIWSDPADRVRAVIFDSAGRISEVRTLLAANINPATAQIGWSGATDPLPPDNRYYNAPISNVRIETQDRNYTWMLTVRNHSDVSNAVASNWVLNADLDLAVFFRRSGAPADELVFSTTAGSPYTISGAGKQYTINWPQGQKPAIKKGGYVLDVEHARWFRIEALSEGANTATFVLDSSPPQALQQACFMRGLVEVFRLGTKTMIPPQP